MRRPVAKRRNPWAKGSTGDAQWSPEAWQRHMLPRIAHALQEQQQVCCHLHYVLCAFKVVFGCSR